MNYTVAKRQDGWHVIDQDGYDVSYVSYDTKKEAMESARILEKDYWVHQDGTLRPRR